MASETYDQPGERPYQEPGGDAYRARTGWVGWIYFAAVLMVVVGTLNAIHGLIAIVNDEWVVWSNRGDLYLDLTEWGWIHLVIGIALVLAGLGVLTGNIVARAVAVLLACVSVIANFLYIPAFPVWAIIVIAIDVFVIYALTAHGGEMREPR
jgi:hypothetical protein